MQHTSFIAPEPVFTELLQFSSPLIELLSSFKDALSNAKGAQRQKRWEDVECRVGISNCGLLDGITLAVDLRDKGKS